MIVTMTSLQLLGERALLHEVVESLQRFGAAEVLPDGAPERPTPVDEELGRVEALLEEDAAAGGAVLAYRGEDPAAPTVTPLRGPELRQVEVELTDLHAARERLVSEEEDLGQYVRILGQLEALVPELAGLTDADLEAVRLAIVALVIDDPQGQLVESVRQQLVLMLGERFVLESAVAGASRGCLLVVPRPELGRVEALLGSDRIVRVDVPDAFVHLSLRSTVEHMRDRLAAVAVERAELEAALAALRQRVRPRLRAQHTALLIEQERLRAVGAAELTRRTFLLRCWVPAGRAEDLRLQLLVDGLEAIVVVEADPSEVTGEPPVQLANRPGRAPFQRLVGFLSWPSTGSVDPTGLMALVFPFLFGVMVGDIGYGLLLMAAGWWLRRRTGVARDAGIILLAGGSWSVVFGVLFGELFGSLGNELGLPALWFYRGGPAALEPLLLFAVMLGFAHVVLGIVLGLWTAVRRRNGHRVAELAGTLVVLLGLAGTIAVLGGPAPVELLPVSVGAMLAGLVMASASHGVLGPLLGPLELIGTVGNILSYLRLAAVGLASVYLANVANELAAQAPLVLGIVVAVFFHLLNLGLAAFSPTVQALRLHYVEFFSKFHDGEGRQFRPLGVHGAPAANLRGGGVPSTDRPADLLSDDPLVSALAEGATTKGR